MAKQFWVNTGHTLSHAGKYLIHACEEIPQEIIDSIKKEEGSLKRLLDVGAITDEKPVVNPATDKGAPSHEIGQLRPVTTSQSQAGPSLPPAVGDKSELPPPPGGQAPQTDATGKPVAPVTAGLTR